MGHLSQMLLFGVSGTGGRNVLTDLLLQELALVYITLGSYTAFVIALMWQTAREIITDLQSVDKP